jgi:predicted GIY-YIG superfamily endonuclease
LYILRCADNSYYIGTTVGDLETRVAEHRAGVRHGYTAVRRPVILVFTIISIVWKTRPQPSARSRVGVERKKKR